MGVPVELDLKAQIAELSKGLKEAQQQLRDLGAATESTNKSMQKNIKQTKSVVEEIGDAFAGIFTAAVAAKIIRQMINVRKEFEVFRVTIANTTGSMQSANREFDKIQKFSQETPFSIRELTDAFVRLTNQGFKPSIEQMRKMGDLATSVNKKYIQLTEAIIDAQTGEFSRLKEFGIQAKKEGDKVTFTFKEQSTTVANTSKAIREYIISLGEAEGVSGSMAAVSGTLEGKITKLRSSWEGLLDVLGGRTEGIFAGAIRAIQGVIDGLRKYNEKADPELAGRRRANVYTSLFGEDFDASELAVINRYIANFSEEIINLQKDISTLQGQGGTGMLDGVLILDKSKVKRLIEQREELVSLVQALKESIPIKEDDEKVTVKQSETLAILQERLKELIQYRQTLNIADKKSLITTNAQIEALQKQIKELQNLRDLTIAEVEMPDVEDLVIKEETEKTKSAYEERMRTIEDFDEWLLDETMRSAEEEIENWKEKEHKKLIISKATIDQLGGFLDILAQRQEANLQADLARAGDNEKAKEKVLKEYAKKDQTLAIARTIINGAEAIIKIGSQLGAFALPFQIASGLQTLAQIAIIRSQKFERGTYEVLKGRRHAQGGVDIGIGEAEEGEGVAVFSRLATQKYGKFLPAFVKAINENEADVTGYSDGAYMIHFDDHKQVQKLEDIKQLLSKPEIRYEKGFRIEIRKGQITKVKI